MSSVRSAAFVLALAAAISSPALAQPAAQTSAAPGSAATTMGSGPTGTLEKTQGSLRSSELVGATVYNDSGASIGTVENLLIGDDGRVTQVVLSVGGFLGVGSKLVNVPFEQLKIQPSRGIGVASSPLSGAGSTQSGATTAGGMVGAPVPAASSAASSPANPAAATSRDIAPNYYSVVMPGATKDSLTGMPAFHYNP